MTSLTLTHRDTAAGPLLHVVGELDYDQAPALNHHVENLTLSAGQCLVIDLAGLDFCDSSGIAALLTARRRAQDAGADLVLAAVPANLLRILTVVGLDGIFTLRPRAEPV